MDIEGAMKKYLWTIPLFVLLAGLTLYGMLSGLQPAMPAAKTVQVVEGLTMLPSTVPVEPELESAVARALASEATERSIFTWAITDVSEHADYWVVSVAGLPYNAERMRLDDALWLGTVTIVDLPDLPGSVDPQPMTNMDQTAVQPDASSGSDNLEGGKTGIGGSAYLLPWRDGTLATYGIAGVHNCGYGTNWKAVDFFPEENMIYASMKSETSYVCRDATQVTIRAAEFIYAHLEDIGQQVGDQYQAGGQIGSVVAGSFDDTCGYAAQQENHYHVHYCFADSAYYQFHADGYVLTTTLGTWSKDGQNYSPGDQLTAEWSTNGDPSQLAPGSNLFDMLAGAALAIFDKVLPNFGHHAAMDLAARILGPASAILNLVYNIVLMNFDMTAVGWVVGIILTVEAARLVVISIGWIGKGVKLLAFFFGV